MKKLIACFALLIGLNSFTEPTYQYPDFIVAYDLKVLPGRPAFEGFKDGEFVEGGVISFLEGIDSIAVKYMVKNEYQCFHPTYTNFYTRAGNNQWKKYGPDKKLIGIITEHRDQIGIAQPNVVYYKVY
jgi:hypothetical protein